jgi:hypothetical protein
MQTDLNSNTGKRAIARCIRNWSYACKMGTALLGRQLKRRSGEMKSIFCARGSSSIREAIANKLLIESPSTSFDKFLRFYRNNS